MIFDQESQAKTDTSQSEDDFQHSFFKVFIFQTVCLLLSSHISDNIADEMRPSLSSHGFNRSPCLGQCLDDLGSKFLSKLGHP